MSMPEEVRDAMLEETERRIPDSDRAKQPDFSIPLPAETDHDAAAEHRQKAARHRRKAAKAKAKNHAGQPRS